MTSVVKLAGSWTGLVVIAALLCLLCYAWLAMRREEAWFARWLGPLNWQVKYHGDYFGLSGLRPYWVGWGFRWTTWRRPLAIKKTSHCEASLFGCVPGTSVTLAVRLVRPQFPRVAIRTRKGMAKYKSWRRSDKQVSEEFPDLCNAWLVKVWGNKADSREVLSNLSLALLNAKEIGLVETRDAWISVTSTRSCLEHDQQMHFATEAMQVLKSFGIPDLFTREEIWTIRGR